MFKYTEAKSGQSAPWTVFFPRAHSQPTSYVTCYSPMGSKARWRVLPLIGAAIGNAGCSVNEIQVITSKFYSMRHTKKKLNPSEIQTLLGILYFYLSLTNLPQILTHLLALTLLFSVCYS